MADTSPDLLPCPFCKNADLCTEMGSTPSPGDYIMCDGPDGCGAMISRVDTPDDDLIGAWNRRATPPSPSTAPEVDERAAFEANLPKSWSRKMEQDEDGGMVYVSDRTLGAWIGWGLGRHALASRPRVKMDPALKAALEEAAKTGATSAALPDGGAVFINRGHDYGDNAHLECTACGGSGHIDDQRQRALASRPAEVDDEGLPPLPKKRGTIYQGNYWTDRDEADPPSVPLADVFTAEQYRQGQRDAVAAYRARREKEAG